MNTKLFGQYGLSGITPAEHFGITKVELDLGINKHAILQLGAIATGIRNSIGGSTYSQNKGGAYVKAKPIPTNPRTDAQRAVRLNFANNAKFWSGTLDDAQRAGWNFFALNNPYTNVFGQAKILSGLAMMMKLNQVLAQLLVAPIEDAPADLTVPPLADATDINVAFSGGALTTLEITTDAQATTAAAKYYIFATAPLSQGKNPAPNNYRYIGAFPSVAAATTIDILTAYQAVFGGGVNATFNIGVLVSKVNVSTGALTPALQFVAQGR